MKSFMLLLVLLLQFPLFAKSVYCAVPVNITPKVKTLFREKIDYTQMLVIPKPYTDNKAALTALLKKEVNFAVIRSDILWELEKGSFKWQALKKKYITISTLPYTAQLYLIRSPEYYDIDIEELKHKSVSIDMMGQANAYLLKRLLRLTGTQHTVQYKSIGYKTSLKRLNDNTLDAFFGFLPSSFENEHFHFQTIFSNRITTYLKNQNLYIVDYNGIHIPYTLIASNDTSDEEIENIIYRLEEKGIFAPQTDEHFGPMNLYVRQHLEQIQLALNAKAAKNISSSIKSPKVSGQACLKYHYGFLDLLRRKPALKKKLRTIRSKYPTRYSDAKLYLKKIETILLNMDAHKQSCNTSILKEKTNSFKAVSRKINTLAR